jgi:hypothetical protein
MAKANLGRYAGETRMNSLCAEIGCSLGCEKVPSVQHGDDLAAREQFFKVVAIAQFFGGQNPFPEASTDRLKFRLTKKIGAIAHGSPFKQRPCHRRWRRRKFQVPHSREGSDMAELAFSQGG